MTIMTKRIKTNKSTIMIKMTKITKIRDPKSLTDESILLIE